MNEVPLAASSAPVLAAASPRWSSSSAARASSERRCNESLQLWRLLPWHQSKKEKVRNKSVLVGEGLTYFSEVEVNK